MAQSEVFGLGTQESFHEHVHDHIFSRVVVNYNLPGFCNIMYKVEANVNVSCLL
jgi:hypothetical protein